MFREWLPKMVFVDRNGKKIKAKKQKQKPTVKTGMMSSEEQTALINAFLAMEPNLLPDQQERRIMATINGTKVLIVVTREQGKEVPMPWGGVTVREE